MTRFDLIAIVALVFAVPALALAMRTWLVVRRWLRERRAGSFQTHSGHLSEETLAKLRRQRNAPK